jgi:hypothetical protein
MDFATAQTFISTALLFEGEAAERPNQLARRDQPPTYKARKDNERQAQGAIQSAPATACAARSRHRHARRDQLSV